MIVQEAIKNIIDLSYTSVDCFQKTMKTLEELKLTEDPDLRNMLLKIYDESSLESAIKVGFRESILCKTFFRSVFRRLLVNVLCVSESSRPNHKLVLF